MLLVQRSRRLLTDHLRGSRSAPDPAFESRFSFPSGVFVTLNRLGMLRGCIGYPYPSQNLSEALAGASISAATEDSRFDPVTMDELDEIVIEVTVLGPPREIHVEDPEEYPSRIHIGRDGIIIRHGRGAGLLLPQVPIEYGWSARELLEHGCEKAGIPRDGWRSDHTSVLVFQAEVFREEEPGGTVIRVQL